MVKIDIDANEALVIKEYPFVIEIEDKEYTGTLVLMLEQDVEDASITWDCDDEPGKLSDEIVIALLKVEIKKQLVPLVSC